MSRTSIVIIAHDSAAVLAECLASIPPGVPTVLVDNGCTDDSVAVALATRPDITVVRPPANLGFGRGANRGFERVSTDFGLLLNADARLTPGVLAALEAAADRYPDAGMLAPEIFGEDGALQFGHATPFTPARTRAMPMPAGDCCLDYVGGSAMFFRMAAFRAIGGFDPAIFLYGEDDDLCLRLTARRLALVHVAGCRIIHAGGTSCPPYSRLDWCKAFHQGWSRLHLQSKHRGLRSAWLLFLLRWPEMRLKAASHRRDPRRVKWHGRAAGMWAWARGRKAAHMGLDPG